MPPSRRYAVTTENAADFTRLAAGYGYRGQAHHGVVVTTPERSLTCGLDSRTMTRVWTIRAGFDGRTGSAVRTVAVS